MINNILVLTDYDKKLNYIKTNWNRIAKYQGFPIVKSFTGERKSQWIRILKKHKEKTLWDEFFIVLGKDGSKWLADATVGSNGFKWFNIDFFYKSNKEDRVIKFIEGFYLRTERTISNYFYNSENNNAIDSIYKRNEIVYNGDL